MARSIDEIQNEMISKKNAEASLSVFNSPSGVAYWRVWTRIISVCINYFEQLTDEAKREIEDLVNKSVSGTGDWLQRKALLFQYSPVIGNEQIIGVIDGRAEYPIEDPSLRIITRASVKLKTDNRVSLKVAKDDGAGGYMPLILDELNSFKGYIDKVGFVGIPTDCISLLADRLFISITVYYSGEYVATNLKNNIKTAISVYLKEISSLESFDGVFIKEKCYSKILAVAGVTGIDTANAIMKGRAEQTTLASASVFGRTYEPASGYIIEEDTASNTWEDSINMVLDI